MHVLEHPMRQGIQCGYLQRIELSVYCSVTCTACKTDGPTDVGTDVENKRVSSTGPLNLIRSPNELVIPFFEDGLEVLIDAAAEESTAYEMVFVGVIHEHVKDWRRFSDNPVVVKR